MKLSTLCAIAVLGPFPLTAATVDVGSRHYTTGLDGPASLGAQGDRRLAITCLCNGGNPGQLEWIVIAAKGTAPDALLLVDNKTWRTNNTMVTVSEHTGNHGNSDEAAASAINYLQSRGYHPDALAVSRLRAGMQQIQQGWPGCMSIPNELGESRTLPTTYSSSARNYGPVVVSVTTEVTPALPGNACGYAEWLEPN